MQITDKNPCLSDIVRLYGEDYDAHMQAYPIWDERKREWLNGMIYNHFAYREISPETPTMFYFFLARKMAEIMPPLNPVFAAIEKADIMSEQHSETKTTGMSEGKSTSNKRSKQKQLTSTTPQTQLSGAENYATGLADASGTDEDSSGTSGREEGRTVSDARSMPVSQLAAAWLTGASNPLLLVYNGLEPLFIQVWDDFSEEVQEF